MVRPASTFLMARAFLVGALVALAALGAVAQGPPQDQRVDSDAPGTASSTLPQVVGTADDALHIVWQEYRGSEWAIYYRRATSFGSGLPLPEVPISFGALQPPPFPNALTPRIASDGVQALYVVWQQFLDGLETIAFVRSMDGGLSWSIPAPLVDSVTGMGVVSEYASPPEIVADELGHVHVAWSQSDGVFDQIYSAVSSDYGATWSVPPITQPVNTVSAGHSEKPELATDGFGHVYIIYMDHRESPYRDLYFRRSVDWGASWEPDELRLSTPGQANEGRLVAHATLQDGLTHRVLVGWIDLAQDAKGGPLTYVRSRHSLDGGWSFSPGTGDVSDEVPDLAFHGGQAGPAPGGQTQSVPGAMNGGVGGAGLVADLQAGGSPVQSPARVAVHMYLELAQDDAGTPYAVFARVDSPLVGQPTAIYANRFDWSKRRWRGERRLSRGGAPFLSKGFVPSLARPQIATDGKQVFAAWMQSTTGYAEHMDVLASWISTDDSAQWSPAVSVTSDPAGPSAVRSAYPQLFARGGRAAVVWDDRRNWTDATSLPLPRNAPVGAPDIYMNILNGR